MTLEKPFLSSTLPEGVTSRFVDNSNGLKMHLLEAGSEDVEKPLVLLLHGFPELSLIHI